MKIKLCCPEFERHVRNAGERGFSVIAEQYVLARARRARLR